MTRKISVLKVRYKPYCRPEYNDTKQTFMQQLLVTEATVTEGESQVQSVQTSGPVPASIALTVLRYCPGKYPGPPSLTTVEWVDLRWTLTKLARSGMQFGAE